jgi:hypothetical protein
MTKRDTSWDDPQLSDGDMPIKKEKTMKFKEGDILEFKGAENYEAQEGATAVFQGYYIGAGDEEYVRVEWVRDDLSGSQDDGGYFEYQFEKVEEEVFQK